jgi:hypothetical protein
MFGSTTLSGSKPSWVTVSLTVSPIGSRSAASHVIATERNVAEARSAEIEELMLLLDEVATAE